MVSNRIIPPYGSCFTRAIALRSCSRDRYARMLLPASGEKQVPACWQLPNGVRTNRVIAEVPRFPVIDLHGKIWPHVGDSLQNVRTETSGKMYGIRGTGLSGEVLFKQTPAAPAPAHPRRGIGWHYLSNATCLMRPHVISTALPVSYGLLKLRHCSPLSKKTCVRQVVLDKSHYYY